jgi:hypothetical protein
MNYFLVIPQALEIYNYLIENLGFEELEMTASIEENEPKLIIDKKSKTFWMVDSNDIIDFTKLLKTAKKKPMKQITLKDIEKWN